jgi:hypothetical protein
MVTSRINLLIGGKRLDTEVLALLLRAEVRETDSDASVLALRFGLVQQPNGEFRPLDGGPFELGALIAFEVEPPGGLPQRLFQGYVTHLRPHFEVIESNGYLEVLAIDAAVVLDAEEKVATWPNMTDSDVVSEVMGTYQITVRAESTPVNHEEDRQLLVQRETDWSFLQRLARRNGMRLYFEYDSVPDEVVARFAPPDILGSPQADLVLLQEGRSLNWADIQLVAAGPVHHAGAALDPIAKRLVRSPGTPSLPVMGREDAADEVEAGLTAAGVGSATALLRDPFPLDAAVSAEATAATDASRFVIELRGEVDPALYRGLLRARRSALVRGVGSRLSGVYYIRSVRTTVDAGTVMQTFVAVRNATGQSGEEPFGQSAEEVPAQ